MKQAMVVHQNYVDEKERFYCRKDHKVKTGDYSGCASCPYFYGSLQGQGVECEWEDYQDYLMVSAYNPNQELLRVSKLMDEKKIPK